MPSENDFARIRAEMLMQQEESPSYDDGASLLMRDPAMMEVGLFGRRPPKPMEPPVNLSRRGILGLGQAAPENLPAVRPADIPLPPSSTLPAPLSTPGAMQPAPAQARPPVQQPTPPHTPTPLEALAQKAINAPMSRREVLQRAGQAAVNQMLPTPKIADVVPEIVAPLMQAAKAAAPAINSAEAAAKIAAYASTIWDNTDNAKKAYEVATGQGVGDNWDDPDTVSPTQLWASVEEGDNYIDAAKAVGLDAETVAAQTGLPLATVKQLIGDGSDLLGEVAGVSNTRNSLEGIMEDGRWKEAARSTSYLDIWNDNRFLNKAAKKAVKEEGPDADGMDVYNNFINQVVDRFREMERGNSEYNSESDFTQYKKEKNPLRSELHRQLIDDNILDDIWGQASEYEGTEYEDVLELMRKYGWTGSVEEEFPSASKYPPSPSGNVIKGWHHVPFSYGPKDPATGGQTGTTYRHDPKTGMRQDMFDPKEGWVDNPEGFESARFKKRYPNATSLDERWWAEHNEKQK